MQSLSFAAASALALCTVGYQTAASSEPLSDLPARLPEPSYRLLPQDVVDIRIFDEPQLSITQVPVDGSGNLTLPLVGEIQAAGKRPAELSTEIAGKLRRFIVDPRVAVMVMQPVPRNIIVEGQVTQPGLYSLPQNATLLSSLAQARGPTRVAKLSEVVVFRRIDGHLHAARFNITDIRKGRSLDPEVFADDRIIVGLAVGKAVFRDFLTIAPFLTAVFVRLD